MLEHNLYIQSIQNEHVLGQQMKNTTQSEHFMGNGRVGIQLDNTG